MRPLVRPPPETITLTVSWLSARCAGCHLPFGIKGTRGRTCDHLCCNYIEKTTECQAVVTLGFRQPLPLPCTINRNAVTLQPQSRRRVSRRLTEKSTWCAVCPSTTSLTAVIMVVSSVSQQLPTRLPRTLYLGAATDGYAHEQVPTEMSGQTIFDITERCYGKIRVRLNQRNNNFSFLI